MTYEIFKKELISLLEERIDADQEIDVRPVLKNNDLWLDGLSILQSSSRRSVPDRNRRPHTCQFF